MDTSVLFNNVMQALWGDTEANSDFIIKSIADKVRGNQRINPENAFDVFDLFGPEYVTFVDVRAADTNEPDVSIHTIKFSDGSSVLIEAKRGQGCGVEVL